jgi:MFS family permease
MVGLAAAAPKPLSGAENAQADAPHFEKVTWYKEPHLRKLYSLSIILLVASATTGYDGTLVNTSQQMDAWTGFLPETKDENKLGILINMFNIGSIIAYFFAPYLADNWGRKPTIMVGSAIMILGSCLSAFCNGYGSKSSHRPKIAEISSPKLCCYLVYIAGRFILGFGNSLAQICSPMLLTEICHPQHRGPLTTVYNCLWNLGSLSKFLFKSSAHVIQ